MGSCVYALAYLSLFLAHSHSTFSHWKPRTKSMWHKHIQTIRWEEKYSNNNKTKTEQQQKFSDTITLNQILTERKCVLSYFYGILSMSILDSFFSLFPSLSQFNYINILHQPTLNVCCCCFFFDFKFTVTVEFQFFFLSPYKFLIRFSYL